jgi:hypothetical protein
MKWLLSHVALDRILSRKMGSCLRATQQTTQKAVNFGDDDADSKVDKASAFGPPVYLAHSSLNGNSIGNPVRLE